MAGGYGFYAREKKYNVRSASISWIVVLCLYYAVVFYHLPNPFEQFAKFGILSTWLHPFILAWLSFAIGGLSTKGGFLLWSVAKGAPKEQALRVFIAINIYLAIFNGAIFLVLAICWYGPELTRTVYFQTSHLFWMAVGLILVFYSIYVNLVRFDLLKWEALSDIRAIPFVSPAFCFGMPVLIKSNVAPIVLDDASFHRYIVLSFSSGIVFVIYLIFYAFTNHAMSSSSKAGSHPVIGEAADRKRLFAERVTSIGFVLFGTAMFLLLLAVLDLVVVTAFGGAPIDPSVTVPKSEAVKI